MRAGMLGDTGDNSPENWLFGDSNAQPVHAVLTIAADKVEDLRAAIAQERQEASVHKVVIVFEQDGGTLTGDRRGKEHFGFKDGVSEPAVQGFDEPDPRKPEWKKGSPGTRIIPAGEFVIGEETVSGKPSGLPEWAKNGSFHVVRRLGGLDGRRIMRRGIPFGLPFDPAGSAGHGPDAARGLVFVSYQADLVRQFEFIQRDWVTDTKFPDRDPRVGADPMIGVTTDVTFKGQPVRFEQFVRTEGAVYAFTPSLSTLDRLADGKLSDDAPKIKIRVTDEGNHEISAVSTFDIGDVVDAGKAKLMLQDDGKLVVFDENDDPRWASNNPATPGARAVFQEDGNFVIYTPDNRPVWASATDGNPGAFLAVQADGNVVIYNSKGGPVWHSRTQH
jgi:hypothetical protein